MTQSPVSCSHTTSPAARAGGPGSVGRVPCAHHAELTHIPPRSAFWGFAEPVAMSCPQRRGHQTWGSGVEMGQGTQGTPGPGAGTAKAGGGSAGE